MTSHKMPAENNASWTRDILTFTVYAGLGSNRYVLLAVVVLVYLATVVANVAVMLLICHDRSLHKPMYIFLFCLILSGLIGSTSFWPNVMSILLTNRPLISLEGCFFQVFLMSTYGGCHFSVLTVMAYDRFVSIFQPLQYHAVMTPLKVKQLLLVANLIPMAVILTQIYLTSQLPLCRYNVNKLFCDNLVVVGLSCAESHTIQRQVNNLYGIFNITFLLGLPILLVLLSYAKIIALSMKISLKARKKVFQTCSPHIITFLNFSLASLFSLFYNRFNPSLPTDVNIVLSINYILVPPLLQPIIYGMKTQEIRQSFTKVARTIFR
ncbi:olfactory receptor 52E4-like [Engraulis encrasicolus]|uniref:olfactory receptor 52E4-like n=1 Tax=Engraulis encrasicolus TaxID=184585 RepID=UPI002FD59935